jgi:hypothetical protein
LFDNITLTRYKADGTEDRRIKVPIIYSPKEKYVARLVGDPDLNKKVSLFEGDITKLQIDAIVNAANKTLLGKNLCFNGFYEYILFIQ